MKKILSLLAALAVTTSVSSSLISCTEKPYSSKVTIVEEEYWYYFKKNGKLPNGIPWSYVNHIEIDKDELNYIEIKPWELPSGEATLIRFIMNDGSIVSQGSKGESWKGHYTHYRDVVLKEAFPNVEVKIVEYWG